MEALSRFVHLWRAGGGSSTGLRFIRWGVHSLIGLDSWEFSGGLRVGLPDVPSNVTFRSFLSGVYGSGWRVWLGSSSVSILFVSACGVTLGAGNLGSVSLGSSVSILFVSAFGVVLAVGSLGAGIFGARDLGLRLSLDWILVMPALGVLL